MVQKIMTGNNFLIILQCTRNFMFFIGPGAQSPNKSGILEMCKKLLFFLNYRFTILPLNFSLVLSFLLEACQVCALG